jgi:hypothetical protein
LQTDGGAGAVLLECEREDVSVSYRVVVRSQALIESLEFVPYRRWNAIRERALRVLREAYARKERNGRLAVQLKQAVEEQEKVGGVLQRPPAVDEQVTVKLHQGIKLLPV